MRRPDAITLAKHSLVESQGTAVASGMVREPPSLTAEMATVTRMEANNKKDLFHGTAIKSIGRSHAVMARVMASTCYPFA